MEVNSIAAMNINGLQPLPDHQESAARKARLIHQALETLKVAQEIDEGQSRIEDWIGWYDAVMGDCQDLERITVAIRIELAARRGRVEIAEGEKRGGYQALKKQSRKKIDFAPENKDERYFNRLIASEPEAIKNYIQTAAKLVFTTAVKVAQKARAQKQPGQQIRRSGERKSPVQMTIPRHERREELLRKLEALSDGTSYEIERQNNRTTFAGLPSMLDMLPAIELLCPWITCERLDSNKVKLTINPILREICAMESARSELGGISIRAFLEKIRQEVRRRREDYLRNKPKDWITSGEQVWAQVEILDWFELELAKIPSSSYQNGSVLAGGLRELLRQLRAELSRRRGEYHRKTAAEKKLWIVRNANREEHFALLDWIEQLLAKMPTLSYETKA